MIMNDIPTTSGATLVVGVQLCSLVSERSNFTAACTLRAPTSSEISDEICNTNNVLNDPQLTTYFFNVLGDVKDKINNPLTQIWSTPCGKKSHFKPIKQLIVPYRKRINEQLQSIIM